MMDAKILSIVTFVYFCAFACYLVYVVFRHEGWGKIATWSTYAGFFLQTVAFVIRWQISHQIGAGHLPITNFYESLVFFSWTMVGVYMLVEGRIKSRVLGVFVLPIAFFLMAYASFSPSVESAIQPLIPALQSNWLTSHVLTCFLAYAAFTVACGLGIMYVLIEKSKLFARFMLKRGAMDELMYQIITLGFVFLTLGIITGSVWAHYAWGSYWSWDPKETSSLVTWLIYAIYLHGRIFRNWRGKRAAFFSVLGFAFVLFTYIGVNYLASLHAYL